MSNHAIVIGKNLLTELGIGTVYVVDATDEFSTMSSAELAFIRLCGSHRLLAFTNAVCDLMFKAGSLRYHWNGRGCCIVFCASPLLMSEAEVIGTMLHEAGHHVAACDKACRDDSDAGRAVEEFWKDMKPESQHHDRRWLRATTNLWHRACRLGYEIPLANVFNLEQYGYSRTDLGPILDEATRRESEPIESILGRTAIGGTQLGTPLRTRLSAMGMSSSGWKAWVGGKFAEMINGVCMIGGQAVSDAEYARVYAQWKVGAA